MAHFMIRWKFSPASVKAMVGHPQDRTAEARRLIESFGGRMLCYYFALGEFDGVAIGEAPDVSAAVAMGMAAGATGAFTAWETTALMTGEEAAAAMRLAHDTKTSYRAPNV